MNPIISGYPHQRATALGGDAIQAVHSTSTPQTPFGRNYLSRMIQQYGGSSSPLYQYFGRQFIPLLRRKYKRRELCIKAEEYQNGEKTVLEVRAVR